MLGRIIDDKYRVVAAIGEGGMSSIYEAEHLGLDRRVAIKVLHPALADDPEAIARLRHEAKVVAAIGHPNICEVFDMGRTVEGSPYLVMELLVGESLADRLKNSGPMPFVELAPLVKQILKALDAAHDKGILHRDLKPENVFIEEGRRLGRPQAKLLDFGISKSMGYDFIEQQRLTHTGMVMGTPYYMAPEQARGDSGLDQRVDLWAIGVIMYEALTGRRPFVATNYNALLVKILTSRPRPVQKLVPHIHEGVASIVDRALSKLREDRFQTAQQFIDALTRMERVVTAEDPHAPTMMLRRRPDRNAAAASPKPVSARDWNEAIDDPPTFIDDEPAAASNALPPRQGSAWPPPASSAYDDIPEPIEPTIQDRVLLDDDWEHSDVHEPAVRLEPREVMPSDAHDTEVIVRSELEAARTEREVRRERLPSDRSDDEDTLPTAVLEPHKVARTTSKRRRAKRKLPGPPRPPRVPRPDPKPDDDEKTTLFDLEAAKKKLQARKADPE